MKVNDENGGKEIAGLILKFRKAFYDYIYKSRKQAITQNMFNEIMWVSILNDIRNDEVKIISNSSDQEPKYLHTHDAYIKEKLNIWFSLKKYFIHYPNKKNMTNQTIELQQRLRIIIDNDNEHISSDEELAFASGQIIYNLLLKSESSNKTHAMLEPFLQKRDIQQFKNAILNTYETYKHAFKIYPTKYGFDKIISELLGAKDVKLDMKDFMTLVMAGFFSTSIFNNEINNN